MWRHTCQKHLAVERSHNPNLMPDTVIVGAGPYGLSIAAHCRHRGVAFRIFGRPMDSWTAHMPKGMMLKSDGFASNIYDPTDQLSLKDFCAQRGIPYRDSGCPVRLEDFAQYGLAFQERVVPELDKRTITAIDGLPKGFALTLEDGETMRARQVVLAVGITHFHHVPSELAELGPQFVSHSFVHHDLEPFKGRNVAVIGAGASATDLAGLLNEAGANVTLVARRSAVTFHTNSMGRPRPLWQRIRHPKSGLGPGLRSRFYASAPALFRYLPESTRLRIVRTHLGPSGGWFAKDKVMGKVSLLLSHTLERSEVRNGKVVLLLRAADSSVRELMADHVIAATGYRVDLERLRFLSPEIRKQIKSVQGSPVLSANFESSVAGLYFTGIAAADTFGPSMRFAFGAQFTARRVSKALAKSASRQHICVPARVSWTSQNE